MTHRGWLLGAAICLLSTAAQADDLWVATTGRSGNPGTRAQPIDTMQNALRRARPGDRVLVSAGVYPGGGWIDARGTAEAPITVVSAHGLHRAVLEGGREGLRIGDGGAYLVFEGLEVRNTTDNVVHIDGDSHHITLRHLYAHDAGTEGDVLKVNQAHHIVVERSEFARPGRRLPPNENPYQECIDFVATDEVIVRDSYIHDGGGNLLYAKGGSQGVVFERNVIADQRAGAADPMVGLGAVTDRNLIAHGGSFEIYDVVFRNNIVVSGRHGALAIYDGRNVNIANNLFVDNDRVLVEFRAGNGSAARSEGVRLVNNVFVDTRGSMPGPLVRQSHGVEGLFLSHNAYYNRGQAVPTSALSELAAQDGYLSEDPRIALATGDRRVLMRALRPAEGSPLAASGFDSAAEPYEVTRDISNLTRDGRRDRGPWNLGVALPPPETDPAPLFAENEAPDAGPPQIGPVADEGGCHARPGPAPRRGPAAPLVGLVALAWHSLRRRRR
ncbi:MAG: right-handed parallel beta-helix repeat-containing protein [Myxococcales bacterium]|nr:right-handed parallel beta-helix repeat-containing protein [Myxococcales bacterium]